MKLTGKCRKSFIAWLQLESEFLFEGEDPILEPEDLEIRLLYAYVIEFFDSISINIYVKPIGNDLWTFSLEWNKPKDIICKDRNEATEKAISEANELYNTKY